MALQIESNAPLWWGSKSNTIHDVGRVSRPLALGRKRRRFTMSTISRYVAVAVAARARLGRLRQGFASYESRTAPESGSPAILRTDGVKLRLACPEEAKQHEAKSKRRYKPFHSNSKQARYEAGWQSGVTKPRIPRIDWWLAALSHVAALEATSKLCTLSNISGTDLRIKQRIMRP